MQQRVGAMPVDSETDATDACADNPESLLRKTTLALAEIDRVLFFCQESHRVQLDIKKPVASDRPDDGGAHFIAVLPLRAGFRLVLIKTPKITSPFTEANQ